MALALELVLTPTVMTGAALAGRRWRGAVSGRLVGLPPTSGPLVLVIALEHGRTFASRSAVGAGTCRCERATVPRRSPCARTLRSMWSWIWIAALYVLGMGIFRWLGGIGAAADAITSWGRATGERHRRRAASRVG